MIRSMTGYGHAQGTIKGMSITFEIKSVNHRYFEFSSRVPRNYGFLDEKLKSYLQDKISRGKVECFVQIDTLEQTDVIVQINHSLANGYVNAFSELSQLYGIKNDITVASFSRYNDIFSVHKGQADEDEILNAVITVASEAVESFVKMREAEGEKLKNDVLFRISEIIKCVEFIESRSPETVKEYNAKLLGRMKELLEDTHIEQQRLLTEAAIFADKVAVDEETVRLRSHLDQLVNFFDSKEAIGRKMDFLVQEINREANTVGSKAQDVEIARCVVNIKSEIEKIREQV
ncbi:MAG: YicC/YloC family endoribonuclease, partial [Eubacteriales bacterium]